MDPLNIGKLNSFFGEGIVLKGKLSFKGILRLDGEFEGEITSGETFIVGKSGVVSADIKTDNVFNFGKIVGNVTAANKISLHARSSLEGNITSPYLVAEEFSFFDGSCQMPVDKRKPMGKGGKSNIQLPSVAIPKSPSDTPGHRGYKQGSSSGKMVAAGIVILCLIAGWFAFGDGFTEMEKMVAVVQTSDGTADIVEDIVKEKIAVKNTPSVALEKEKEPSPPIETAPKPADEIKKIISKTEQFEQEINQNPLDPQPWLQLAFISLKKKQYKKAILTLEKSLKALPQNSALRMLMAKTYQKVGREKEARKHFIILAKNDSGSIEAKGNEGYQSLERGSLDQAANTFSNILAEDPENHRARLGLATIYSRREENEKAAIECLKILEYVKDYAPAMNRLAWIYAKQGVKLREAKILSQRSIKVFSEIPEYLDTLSEINFRLGEYEKAIDLINKAIALAPSDSYYGRQLFKFERAKNRAG